MGHSRDSNPDRSGNVTDLQLSEAYCLRSAVSVILSNTLAAWMQFPVVFSTDMIK